MRKPCLYERNLLFIGRVFEQWIVMWDLEGARNAALAHSGC